ncbi:hypothetical protein Tco_0359601 [Tanacetum coccineum]
MKIMRYLSLVDLLNLVADETVYKEWEDRMERAATTVHSLAAQRRIYAQIGLRLNLTVQMIHLSQEVTHLEVGRTVRIYKKITRKQSKTGQARTRERKSAQKPEAKPRKVKTSVKQDRSVKSKDFISSLSSLGYVAMEVAQRGVGFALNTLSKQAQMSLKRIATLAIRCMRTRSQARNRNRRQQQLTTVIVEEPEFPMADNRTMAQMLQAPIEGYEDAIVVPPINANNFELKQPLINLVQSNKFTGRQDPHNHLRFFNKVTSTFRHPEVPNTSIKLLLFPFSLDGEARDWLDKEPPRSILTWDDLVLKS